MPSYNVKTETPRSFTQQLFLKSGGSAILRMKGSLGVIESEKTIPERDLNFVLTMYRLVMAENVQFETTFVEDVAEEPITTTKKPIKKSTKVSTTTSLPEFQFIEDL